MYVSKLIKSFCDRAGRGVEIHFPGLFIYVQCELLSYCVDVDGGLEDVQLGEWLLVIHRRKKSNAKTTAGFYLAFLHREPDPVRITTVIFLALSLYVYAYTHIYIHIYTHSW